LYLPDEDGQTLDSMSRRSAAPGQLDIAIIHLPRIANFDDFDPLAADAEVCLRFVNSLETLGHPDVVLVPGTKSTVADMKWLAESGLGKRIVELSRNGTSVVGICGGYQLLGRQIVDPDGVESSCPEIAGLGLLSHTTIFAQEKITNLVRAEIQDDRHCSGSYGHVVSGYEIHMGRTQQGKVPESEHSWLKITDRGGSPTAAFDGSVSEDGRIWGCYLHGLFANDGFRRAWLNSLKKSTPFRRRAEVAHDVIDRPTSAVEKLDAALNSLADHVEASLDMNRLNEIIWPDGRMNRV
jgi:adenosylcobyric acid synthase